ncbi:MAG TPA: hypothetical protein VFR41_02500 [Acidimicrobiia bacterium]|nr:hypothetical protein [Acidimicrobiia bacterium]
MKRHGTDLIALLFGLAFIMVGGAFVVYENTDTQVDATVLGAIGLVVLGLVALVATLTRTPREHHES